jgi:hypothetical protein
MTDDVWADEGELKDGGEAAEAVMEADVYAPTLRGEAERLADCGCVVILPGKGSEVWVESGVIRRRSSLALCGGLFLRALWARFVYLADRLGVNT